MAVTLDETNTTGDSPYNGTNPGVFGACAIYSRPTWAGHFRAGWQMKTRSHPGNQPLRDDRCDSFLMETCRK